jgi:hypothetical protein
MLIDLEKFEVSEVKLSGLEAYSHQLDVET